MILSIILVSTVIFADLGNTVKPYPDSFEREKYSETNFDGASAALSSSQRPKLLGHRIKGRYSDSGTESYPSNSTAKTPDGSSPTPGLKSNQGDLRPRPKWRRPEEGNGSPNPSSISITSTDGSSAATAYCGGNKVPFSCYDQGKLKDYCTQTFGTIQVLSGNQQSGMKRYTVDTTKKATWFEAVGLCLARNMSLATVESSDEQMALSEALNNAGRVQNAWLSATDLVQTNHYVWMTTGQPVTWNNWYNGEPNHENSGNETEHCVEVINYRWKWNDNLCNNKQYFVCQYYSNN